MTNEMTCIHAIASGNVQGVGFRYTTQRHARLLGLQGTVCNLSDGTVEIYAQGPRLKVSQLFEEIKKTIGEHNIREISKVTVPVRNFDGFEILKNM